MKILDLSNSLGAPMTVDDSDAPLLEGLTLYLGANGYAYYSKWRNGRSHPKLVHRLILSGPPGTHVDHINGNKLDNRRSNLRVVTPQLNQVNRKNLNKNNTSGIRGVQRTTASSTKPWRAQIGVNGGNVHLGLFATEAEAVAARRAAEAKHFGEVCP